MAARSKAPAAQNGPKPPEGFRKVDLRPQELKVEAGFEMVGVLGEVAKSRNPEMPDYRTIKAEGKRYFLPSHAGLRGLMDFPVGTVVWIALSGGSGTKKDPYQWTTALLESTIEADEAVPFPSLEHKPKP